MTMIIKQSGKSVWIKWDSVKRKVDGVELLRAVPNCYESVLFIAYSLCTCTNKRSIKRRVRIPSHDNHHCALHPLMIRTFIKHAIKQERRNEDQVWRIASIIMNVKSQFLFAHFWTKQHRISSGVSLSGGIRWLASIGVLCISSSF